MINGASLVFVITFLVLIYLLVSSLVFALRRQRPQATRRLIAVLGLLAGYTAVLLVVSARSTPKVLARNEDKCFDEWCVSLVKAQPLTSASASSSGEVIERLTFRISNHGRRTQRPYRPRLFVAADKRVYPVATTTLSGAVRGGGVVYTNVDAPIPSPLLGSASILITEGGEPSVVVIGDENNPWHAKAMWPVTPSHP